MTENIIPYYYLYFLLQLAWFTKLTVSEFVLIYFFYRVGSFKAVNANFCTRFILLFLYPSISFSPQLPLFLMLPSCESPLFSLSLSGNIKTVDSPSIPIHWLMKRQTTLYIIMRERERIVVMWERKHEGNWRKGETVEN